MKFEDEDIPNVNGNPLLDHRKPKINEVESDPELQIERDARAVCMPMGMVHEALLKAGMLNREQKKKKETDDQEGPYCQYHKRSIGHFVQDCQDFLDLVQEIMNKGRIEFCKETRGQVVDVLQGETPKLVTICYRGEGQQAPAKAPICPTPKVMIKVPTPWFSQIGRAHV